ncbi:MAG: glycosyltransferase family 2 protein [Halarchaeum sp.]
MDLSVIVPTLNARARLERALDALAARVPGAEVIVVNGPSSDGTSGMVREHAAADVLLELSDRNLNAARNAGFAAANGAVVAFVSHGSVVREGWFDALRAAFDDGAAVATGPVHRAVSGGVTTEGPETRTIAGRDVTYFDGGNVAFARDVIAALDGFDEYLDTGGARDAAHRLAGLGYDVAWRPDLTVLREEGDDVADRVAEDAALPIWGSKYRSLGYRLAKNYGLRGTVAYRVARHALGDARSGVVDVLAGRTGVAEWVGNGRAVVSSALAGVEDGLAARRADRSDARNPNGASSRMDRALSRYDA